MMQNTVLSTAYAAFDQVADICQRYHSDASYQTIQKMVADKRQSASATIMVYGVYNAGKSSLINALLGEEDRAPIADKPETARVQGYRWRNYEILDTPGIDAPIEHQQITEAQLYSADAVIFVVNPLGVVEEAKTLNTLLKLIARKKRVFVVLNCKHALEPQDAERIKNELRTRIQKLAEEDGLNHILADIPILEVNAKTALKAKLEQKQALLARSGFPRFEAELNQFLDSIDDTAITAGFVSELVIFLEATLAKIKAQSKAQTQDASIEEVNQFFKQMGDRQTQLRSVLKNLIEIRTALIEKKAFSLISADPAQAQAGIESLVQTAHAEIANELEVELNRLMADSARLLNTLQESVSISDTINAPHVDHPNTSASSGRPLGQAESWTIDPAKLQLGLQQLSTIVKPEHLVQAMQVGKGLLPALFKEIGPATMNKISGQVFSKVMPALGVVLTAWQVGKSLLGDDPEETRLRDEARQQEQARERQEEAIRDVCQSLAWEFSTTSTKMVDDHIQSYFTQVNNSLGTVRNSLNAQQQAISQDLAHVDDALRMLKSHA